MIEQGPKEIARLMRERENSTKVAGEQEAEVREQVGSLPPFRLLLRGKKFR
jgi:hypothetical protein